jgi:HAD superfamily hydrolase (TIGR01662 family)
LSEIRGVCFDLGSTLLQFDGSWNQNTIQSGVDQMVAVLERHASFDRRTFTTQFLAAIENGRAARERDFLERRTGDLLKQVFSDHTGMALDQEIIEGAMEALYAVTQQVWEEMPGMRAVLDDLSQSGYRLSIISNAADAQDVHRLIDQFNIRSYFDPILISAEHRYRKPHQKMFRLLLQAWKLPPESVVMVGDTLNADIAGAQQAGMHQIWLKRPSRPYENAEDDQQIHPEQTATSLQQVPELINNLGLSN